MPGLFGDFVAKSVLQGRVTLTVSAWTPLVSSGSTPYPSRRHVRLFARSNTGLTVALQYVNKNADGTFTTPTNNAGTLKTSTQFPGGSTWIEPVGDTVNVYGRLLKKAGQTAGSISVIVTEYR